jgi:hypothetical protein
MCRSCGAFGLNFGKTTETSHLRRWEMTSALCCKHLHKWALSRRKSSAGRRNRAEMRRKPPDDRRSPKIAIATGRKPVAGRRNIVATRKLAVASDRNIVAAGKLASQCSVQPVAESGRATGSTLQLASRANFRRYFTPLPSRKLRSLFFCHAFCQTCAT